MTDARTDFMIAENEYFRRHCGGGDITGLTEGMNAVQPATDHSAQAPGVQPGTATTRKANAMCDSRTGSLPATESRATARVGVIGGTATVLARIWPDAPDASVILGVDHERETRDRTRAAIINSGYEWPRGTVNVQVTRDDDRPYGTLSDLAIACAILAAAGHIRQEALDRIAVTGELDLAGWLRASEGIVASVNAAAADGLTTVIVPGDTSASQQLHQAPVDPAATVYSATCLPEAVDLLNTIKRQGTPGEDAGPCAQCDRPLVWDRTGRGVNDEWGEYICSYPRRSGKAVHVLAQ